MGMARRVGTDPSELEVERLRALVQTFVRSFGLLLTRETPCGQPISPSHAHALMVLLERERLRQSTSQADLAAALGLDKSSVARLCARMAVARHAVQDRSPDDGRSRLVRLTTAGARLARRIEQASRDRFGKILGCVATTERRALFDSLALLNAAVETLRTDTEMT
jgi:DNA-binding MarR family transcriptional regulator